MAEPIGFHITMRVEGDRDLAASKEARRLFSRTVLRACRPFALLASNWVDTHGHLLTMGSREEAGEAVRRVQIALQLAMAPGAPFERAHFTPVRDASHLRNVFRYILGQAEHHGVQGDRFHDASNGPDLIGARVVGVWTAVNVRRYLRRVRREHILEAMGLPDPDGVAVVPLLDLRDAAAASVAAATLGGRTPDLVSARVAAVAVAGPDAARLLGLPPRTLHRLRASPADPAIVRAIQQQLAMRAIW
jgi:hypothetical protein